MTQYYLPLWARNAKASAIRFGRKSLGSPLTIVAVGEDGSEGKLVPSGPLLDHPGYGIHSQVEVPTPGGHDPSEVAAHLRFGMARTKRKLVDFVRDFGPVLSAPMFPADKEECDGKVAVAAAEDVNELSKERARFATLLSLVVALKVPECDSKAFHKVMLDVRKKWGRGEPPVVPVGDQTAWLVETTGGSGGAEDARQDLKAFLLPFQFGRHEVWDPDEKRTITVTGPDPARKGFRQVLYGLLNEELFGHGDLRSCKNPKCGSAFRPSSSKKEYCTTKCQEGAKASRSYARRKERAK